MISEETKQKLLKETLKIRENAYSVYSNFKVGCTLIDDEERQFQGVNVENCSYGLTICAERSAICQAVCQKMKKIKYICIVGDTEDVLSPCGSCRQVMFEFSRPDTVVIMANLKGKSVVTSMEKVLPYAFSQNELKDSLANKSEKLN